MSINVREELYTAPASTNHDAISSQIVQVRPVTSNITSGAVSGDLIIDITTGANQYLDLYKSHFVVNFTTSSTTETIALEMLATCIFDRGQLFIDGLKICNSNYYTQDSCLSKRINFSEDHNKAQGMRYLGSAAISANYPNATKDTINASIEHLDGLFLRTKESVIPPNRNLRLVMALASNVLQKCAMSDGSDSAVTLAINDIYFNAFYLTRSEPIPAQMVGKFVTIDSFKSTISGTSHNQQYTCRKNLCRLAAAFQSTAAESTTLTTKIYNATLFRYVTDGMGNAIALTTKPNTIQFKAGSQTLPSRELSTTYGNWEIHNMFRQNAEASLLDGGGESFDAFVQQGCIYTVPVVKSLGEDVRSAELRTTFASAPAAASFFFLFYEQYIKYEYGQLGQPLQATILG